MGGGPGGRSPGPPPGYSVQVYCVQVYCVPVRGPPIFYAKDPHCVGGWVVLEENLYPNDNPTALSPMDLMGHRVGVTDPMVTICPMARMGPLHVEQEI